jgi:hypothetical protein
LRQISTLNPKHLQTKTQKMNIEGKQLNETDLKHDYIDEKV